MERKLVTAALFIEREIGLRVMRPTTFGACSIRGQSLPLIMVVQCGQVCAGTTKVSSFDRPLLSVSTSYAGRSTADVFFPPIQLACC